MKKAVFLLIIVLLITGCSVKKVQELTDSERFAGEYGINEDNPFVYASYEDIETVLNGSGIIFFGTTDIEGSMKVAKLLYSTAIEENVDLIYYYNPLKLKEKEPKKYKELVKYFKKFLTKDNNISMPTVVSIKDGKIVGYSNYYSKEEQLSEEKLTKKKKKNIKEKYRKIINYEKCTNFCS